MKSKKYTDKQIEFLRPGYLLMSVRDLAKSFNKEFGTEKTEGQIKSTLQNHKLRCGRKPKDRLINRLRLFTSGQITFLRDNYVGRSVVELTKLFNERFGVSLTREQIKTAVANRRITSGRTGCFPKGHRPWNCGTKGQGLTGANSGSFKKGNVPANRKPLLTTRVCPKDGFILMKIPETDPYTGFPTRYKHKHVYIWEQKHGPRPKGMVVAFIDGDKTNCEPENLMLITRAELLNLNRHGYKSVPNSLKSSVLALSTLQVKTWRKEKGER